ncbi:MAG: DUF4340 domain-containing protein, partial [Candidatus Hydrogenedentes bacterium]|nr:DUF4340 domain-containing protein [Candidatus Hydrogenedentota bacterium]
KTLLEQNKETITRITLQYPNKKIVFEKKEVIVETPEKTEGENEGTNEGETPSIPVEPEAKFEWVLSQGGFAKNYTEQELETLLTKFAMLTISDVADPDRKEEWGFSPPLYKLTISRNDGDDIVLLGGHNTPGGDSYVQLEDAKPALIFEIAKYNFEQIFPQGSKLFSLPEWTIEKDTIGRIEIQRTDGQVVLIKEEEKWRVIEPAIDLELQKTTIDSLLTAASSLKPVDYVDSNEDIGLFDTTVIISTNDGKSRTLYLGQPSKHTDGRYVKFDDSKNILVLSRTDIEKIEPPMRDLFTLSLLDFDQKIIGSVAVNHNETNLLLERNPADGEKWQCTVNEKQSETLLNNVEEFIYTLNAFQVDNFLLEQSPDAVQVVSTITVNQMEKAPVMIQLSAENNGMYQAVISGLPYVFSVKTDEVSRIIDDMQVFLDIPEEKDAAEEVTTQIKAPDAIPVDGVNILETDAAGSENAVEIVIPSLETTANEDI